MSRSRPRKQAEVSQLKGHHARLPVATQRAIAEALRRFAAAAGEGPGRQWLRVQPEERP